MKAKNYPALCFGKLPSFDDFIRFNANGAEVRAFDQWIQEGLYRTSKHFDQIWNTIYDNAPAYHFIFCSDDTERFLVGIFHLSHDKSERKYPFVVSKQIEKKSIDSNNIQLIPLIFAEFFDQSIQIVREGLQGLPQQEIKTRVDELCGSFHENSPASFSRFENYLTKTIQDKFWSCLFGHFDDPRKFLIIKNLVDIVSPLHPQELSHLALGLRFPLSGNIDSIENEVCLWMQVCKHLLGNPGIIPNVFWRIPDNDGQNYLFFFFRQPSSKIFTQLLEPESENDSICKLEVDGYQRIDDIEQSIPSEYRLALENKQLTLSDFLEKLEVFGTK